MPQDDVILNLDIDLTKIGGKINDLKRQFNDLGKSAGRSVSNAFSPQERLSQLQYGSRVSPDERKLLSEHKQILAIDKLNTTMKSLVSESKIGAGAGRGFGGGVDGTEKAFSGLSKALSDGTELLNTYAVSLRKVNRELRKFSKEGGETLPAVRARGGSGVSRIDDFGLQKLFYLLGALSVPGAGMLSRGISTGGVIGGSAMSGLSRLGLGGLGGMGTLAGGALLAGGTGLALGAAGLAYGMGKSYYQMMGEQPARMDLMGRIGGGQYESIARGGGALYSGYLGYNINQQLGMAGTLAGQMGGGAGLVPGMQTMMEARRLYGVDEGMMAGLGGAAFRMGGGAEDMKAVFANAITAGVDKSKLTVIIPQAIQAAQLISEQMFAGIGRSMLDEMSGYMTRLYVASGQNAMLQPERTARMLGTIGERMTGVAMGGGDLAFRAFMFRAMQSSEGGNMGMFQFLRRSEQGATPQNVSALIRQAGQEYGFGRGTGDISRLYEMRGGKYVNEQRLLGFEQLFRQQFGFTGKQTEEFVKAWAKIEGDTGKTKKEKAVLVEQELEKRKKEVFEASPEGKLLKSQTGLTNTFSNVGQSFTTSAARLNESLVDLATVLKPISKGFEKLFGDKKTKEEDTGAKELEEKGTLGFFKDRFKKSPIGKALGFDDTESNIIAGAFGKPAQEPKTSEIFGILAETTTKQGETLLRIADSSERQEDKQDKTVSVFSGVRDQMTVFNKTGSRVKKPALN